MLAFITLLRCSSRHSVLRSGPWFCHHLSAFRMSTTSTSNNHASTKNTSTIGSLSARPILLILDFDGTLTMRDTMHLVAEAGYAHQRASNASPQPTPWSEIVDAYMADFKAHVSEYTPKTSERESPEQESAWLSSLKDIEEASIQRACAAGIFDDVSEVEMDSTGRRAVREGHVRIRAGWDKLLTRVHEHNVSTSNSKLQSRVLSVNWSSTFIRGVVRQGHEESRLSKLPALDQHVYANEIPSILGKKTTSNIDESVQTNRDMSIRTSDAKAKLLQSFRDDECNDMGALLIYVGDSSTDLDCLLEADLGFCIHDEPMGSGQKELAETCQRIGIDVRSSTQFQGQVNTRGKTLWSVKNFSEILNSLEENGMTACIL